MQPGFCSVGPIADALWRTTDAPAVHSFTVLNENVRSGLPGTDCRWLPALDKEQAWPAGQLSGLITHYQCVRLAWA